MHAAEQFHTLEEQVADMKRRGIDPSQAYKDLDRKKKMLIGVMLLGKKMASGSQRRLLI